MNKPDSSLQHAVGKQIHRDIFSASGVLLVPDTTILSQEHVKILEKHRIELNEDDYSPIAPDPGGSLYENDVRVDETVLLVTDLFDEVRKTKKIPMASFRKDVIPVIHEATVSKRLLPLFASLQAKDDYTYRHNVAVAAISTLIGTWMGMEQQELLQLTTGAFLHDIGKMQIPEHILNKPGKLTKEEFEVMKTHTVLGYEMIKETVGVNHRQALAALQHHERMDGSGYPFGIPYNKIDLFSRIVSVADVFHAMTSKRIYKNASPFYEVLDQMNSDAFGKLDPVITRLFTGKMMSALIGNEVLLTDGRQGIIWSVTVNFPTRPLIQIGEEFIDLSQESDVYIKQIF